MAIKRRPPEDVESLMHRGTQWIIVYGDLMSYLMIFFLILFSFASAKKGNFVESLKGIEKAFGQKDKKMTQEAMKEVKVQSEIQSFLVAQNLTRVARVVMTEQELKVVLTSPVLFPSGSAELHRKSFGILHEIAMAMKDMPNYMTVQGFTDNVPIHSARYSSNWELSAARAMQVVKYFIEEEKVSPTQISFTGYGEFQPEYNNDTEEHRGLNRRIEIIVHRILVPFTPAASAKKT